MVKATNYIARWNKRPVCMKYFFERRSIPFTYCKPLMMHLGQPPQELNRLDSKIGTHAGQPTASTRQRRAFVDRSSGRHHRTGSGRHPETGVVTQSMLDALAEIKDNTLIIGDSRRSLRDWPSIIYKMNAAELAQLTDQTSEPEQAARTLAAQTGSPVFMSLNEHGSSNSARWPFRKPPRLPVSGEIDIVGAGDAVMANITTALASQADLKPSNQTPPLPWLCTNWAPPAQPPFRRSAGNSV